MNRFLLPLLAFGWLLIPGAMPVAAQSSDDTTGAITIPIDTQRSVVQWKGTEMWESGKHEGTVRLSSGHLLIQEGLITGGEFVADMHTIAITDIPKDDPIPRRNLRDHLKSEDFFYVEKYPAARFKITKTENTRADSFKVWGQLSIRDVTKPISFVASRKSVNQSVPAFSAGFKINRFAWNISYQGSYWQRITSILDNTFVDADFTISVELVASSAE